MTGVPRWNPANPSAPQQTDAPNAGLGQLSAVASGMAIAYTGPGCYVDK
jgi:hypothetical protein